MRELPRAALSEIPADRMNRLKNKPERHKTCLVGTRQIHPHDATGVLHFHGVRCGVESHSRSRPHGFTVECPHTLTLTKARLCVYGYVRHNLSNHCFRRKKKHHSNSRASHRVLAQRNRRPSTQAPQKHETSDRGLLLPAPRTRRRPGE